MYIHVSSHGLQRKNMCPIKLFLRMHVPLCELPILHGTRPGVWSVPLVLPYTVKVFYLTVLWWPRKTLVWVIFSRQHHHWRYRRESAVLHPPSCHCWGLPATLLLIFPWNWFHLSMSWSEFHMFSLHTTLGSYVYFFPAPSSAIPPRKSTIDSLVQLMRCINTTTTKMQVKMRLQLEI